MGCCVSTTDKASSAPQKHQHLPSGSDAAHVKAMESKAPPPLMEEETVKEVLSETPTPKPPIVTNANQLEEEKKTHEPVFMKIREEETKMEKKSSFNNPAAAAEEISEVSETWSLSESVSTTTITDRRDDEEQEVRQRSPPKFQQKRSFSGDLGAKRERVMMGKSLTRRSDQSPGRRNGGSVRLAQSRDAAGQGMVRRTGLRTEPNWRDPGENSGRRPSSPATRPLVGRNPSARITHRSPGRVATAHQERKVEENTTTTDESLENPLVSLECFIFL